MQDAVREICYTSEIIKSILDETAIEELIKINDSRNNGYTPSVVLIELSARIFKVVRQWGNWNIPMSKDEEIDRNREFARFCILIFPSDELIESFLTSNQEIQRHLYELVLCHFTGGDISVYAGCLAKSGIRTIGPVVEVDKKNFVRDCLKFYEVIKDIVKNDPKASTLDLTSPNDFIVDGFASESFERKSVVYRNIRGYPRTVILLRLVYGDTVMREFLTKFREHEITLDSSLILDILENWQDFKHYPTEWTINMARTVL